MEKGKQLLREGIVLIEKATKFAKAIFKFETALAIFLANNNHEMTALCRSYLGLAYRNDKQYEAALEQFQEFLNLVRDMKDSFGMADAYLDIGMTLSLQRKYDSSLEMLKMALKIIQEQLKDKDLEATLLANLGGVYLLKGDFETAFANYKEGATIADKFDFVDGSAECSKGLAEIYLKKGNFELAEKYFQKSLGLFRIIRDKRSQSDILFQLGVIASQFGKYEDAVFYFKQALKIKTKLKDLVGMAFCEKNLNLLQEKLTPSKSQKNTH